MKRKVDWHSLSPVQSHDTMLSRYRAGQLECVRTDGKPLSRAEYRSNISMLSRQLQNHSSSTSCTGASFKIRHVDEGLIKITPPDKAKSKGLRAQLLKGHRKLKPDAARKEQSAASQTIITSRNDLNKPPESNTADLYSKLKEKQQLLQSKMREEEALKQRISQLNDDLKFNHSLFDQKLKTEKSFFRGRYKNFQNKMMDIKELISKAQSERNFYIREARALEQALMSLQLKDVEQQTNLKNIAKGKINVQWYQNLSRAKILALIIFNSANQLQKMPYTLDHTTSLYLDTEPSCLESLDLQQQRLGQPSTSIRELQVDSRQSGSKAYDFVVAFLDKMSSTFISRLFDQPYQYIGMYGVWLFCRGEWRCVIVDDRVYTGSPIRLWDLALQKALMKTIGSIKDFNDYSLGHMFTMITGSSYFPILTTPSRNKIELVTDLQRWLGDNRVVCATEYTTSGQRYYTVQGVQRKNQDRSFVCIKNIEDQSFQVVSQHFDGRVMSLFTLNFQPDFYFSSQNQQFQPDAVDSIQMEVLDQGRSFLRLQLEGVTPCFVLNVRMYKQINNSLVLIGQKKSYSKDNKKHIQIYFQHNLIKGNYMLLCQLQKREGYIIPKADIKLIDLFGETRFKKDMMMLGVSVHSKGKVEIGRVKKYHGKHKLVNNEEYLSPVKREREIAEQIDQMINKVDRKNNSISRAINQVWKHVHPQTPSKRARNDPMRSVWRQFIKN